MLTLTVTWPRVVGRDGGVIRIQTVVAVENGPVIRLAGMVQPREAIERAVAMIEREERDGN